MRNFILSKGTFMLLAAFNCVSVNVWATAVAKPGFGITVRHDDPVGGLDVTEDADKVIHSTMVELNRKKIHDVLVFAFFLAGKEFIENISLTDDQAAFILKIYDENPLVDRRDFESMLAAPHVDTLFALKKDPVLESFSKEVEEALGKLIQKMINQYYQEHATELHLDTDDGRGDPNDPIIEIFVDPDEEVSKQFLLNYLKQLNDLVHYDFVRSYLVAKLPSMISILGSPILSEYNVIEDEEITDALFSLFIELDQLITRIGKKTTQIEQKTIEDILGYLDPDDDRCTDYEKYENDV